MSEPPAYRFGNWRLVPGQRVLELDGRPAKLGGRAFDMLVTLVEHRHHVISKHELMDLVWPRLVVEENNLQVQMVALRKLLGHPAIATVPGRGYRFTLPVQAEGDAPGEQAPGIALPPASAAPSTIGTAPAARPGGNLPVPLQRLYGRENDMQMLLELMRGHRLVTVAGAGGIGKTRLAECAAAAATGASGQAGWWVELAPVGDMALVASAVAQAIGAQPGAGRDAVENIAAALGDAPTLLVLDNAEHLLDAVTAFQQALSARLPALRWLVTSQETLRLADEQVLRLNPLAVPDESRDGDAGSVSLASGAVQLFLARVTAADPRFALRAEQADAVLDICRQLDGIPLALELAAARVPLLGLEGVRARLSDRFKLLSAGSRAVLRRHQTLRAALEWSHALLSETERRVFRRLGVFVGGFTLEAVQRVAEDDGIDEWDVIEHVGSLVDKSLVLTDGMGADAQHAPRCHLLETTRLFALEQLAEAGETDATLRRHGQAMDRLLGLNAPLYKEWARGRRRAEAAAEVPNVRAASDWAAAGGGDPAHALALHAALITAFGAAGLMREGLERLQALAARVEPALPARQQALFWTTAAIMSGGRAHRFSLKASQQAVPLWRELGEPRKLFECLTMGIGLRARMGELDGLAALIDEGKALVLPEFSPNLRSNFHWAQHRWWLAQGRADEALRCALAQAEAVAGRGDGFEHVLYGGNAAWCELAGGDAIAALVRARAAVQVLRERGDTGNHLGYPLQVLAEALLAQGCFDEGLAVAREAQPRLAADSDDVPLLEPLALAGAQRGRSEAAARIVAHVDAAFAHSGQRRWPFEAARRAAIDAITVGALGEAECQRQSALGARLSRSQAVALAFGDEP